jgi:hypothetical protein
LLLLTYAEVAAVTRDRDTYPLRWMDGQAIVTLPEQIDVSDAGQIREQLLSVINRGAAALIADLTATLSCDHAGAEAVVRHLSVGLRLKMPVPMVGLVQENLRAFQTSSHGHCRAHSRVTNG